MSVYDADIFSIETLTPHPPSPHEHSSPSSPSSSTTPLTDGLHESGRPDLQHLDSRTPIMPKRMHVCESSPSDKQCSASGALRGLNATLGMVIHGAADGIALGASSLSAKGNLGLIVFIAVLVHKGQSLPWVAELLRGALISQGPTALGLTTTLLSLGLDHAGIRKRLLIFSSAAPLGAILTFMLVQLFGGNSTGFGSAHGHGKGEDVDGLQWWTGIALLFSVRPFDLKAPRSHSD